MGTGWILIPYNNKYTLDYKWVITKPSEELSRHNIENSVFISRATQLPPNRTSYI